MSSQLECVQDAGMSCSDVLPLLSLVSVGVLPSAAGISDTISLESVALLPAMGSASCYSFLQNAAAFLILSLPYGALSPGDFCIPLGRQKVDHP